MPEASSSPSLTRRLVALVVLLIAAYVLFKVVIGTLIAIFWGVLVVAAIVAVIWAYTTLKRR